MLVRLLLAFLLVAPPAFAGQAFGLEGGRACDCGTGGFHFGIDLPAAPGAAVTAADRGVVVKVEDDEFALTEGGGRCGRYLVIRHNFPNGRIVYTRYAHLGRIIGEKGRRIAAGLTVERHEKIAEAGGSKLFHFEIRPVDPYIVERIGTHTIDDPSMNWLYVHPVDPRKFDFDAFRN